MKCCNNDYGTFENFLLMQKNLKVLRLSWLHKGLLFETDKLANNIKFSLDELSLDKVHWTDNDNVMKFFKTQINLKKLTLNLITLDGIGLDYEICYNELLIHLFGNNLQLKTVDLSTSEFNGSNIKDFSFLEGIVNSSVENFTLSLNTSQNVTEFIKLFPNVVNFTYYLNNKVDHGLDQFYNWNSLESINCTVEYIDQFFENVNFGENITNCTITYYVGDINQFELMQFLNCHQSIKHMTLNSYYTKVPEEILYLIVTKLKSLETLINDGEIYSLSYFSENLLSQYLKEPTIIEGSRGFRTIANTFSKTLFTTLMEYFSH